MRTRPGSSHEPKAAVPFLDYKISRRALGTSDSRSRARYWLQNYRFPVARVRVRCGKLPLFGEPRTRRRFSKQYYAVR